MSGTVDMAAIAFYKYDLSVSLFMIIIGEVIIFALPEEAEDAYR